MSSEMIENYRRDHGALSWLGNCVNPEIRCAHSIFATGVGVEEPYRIREDRYVGNLVISKVNISLWPDESSGNRESVGKPRQRRGIRCKGPRKW